MVIFRYRNVLGEVVALSRRCTLHHDPGILAHKIPNFLHRGV